MGLLLPLAHAVTCTRGLFYPKSIKNIFLLDLTMYTSSVILNSARGSFVDGRPLVLCPLCEVIARASQRFFEVNGISPAPGA